MDSLILFCGISVAFTGLASGFGVLPDSVNATVGGTVVFNTSLPPTQTPFITISWNYGLTNIITSVSGGNNTSPEYVDRITVFISTGSMELRSVVPSDRGEYRVSITTAEATTHNGAITLNVYEPVSNVRVTVSSSDLVEFNSSVTLSCSANGTDLTTFLWSNGSTEVTAGDRVNLTDGGETLTINTVWRYDQGPFTCKVSNSFSSSTSVPAELSISYGPDDAILSSSPLLDHYEEGSDVSLSCSADSRPAAQFKWLLNGEFLSFTGAQIQLKNLQTSQSGNYSCQAFNSKTLRYKTSQPVRISVLKRITNPHVSASNKPIEGSSLNLTCDASGPIFTRKWSINGPELNPSENIVFYDQNRVLSFKVLNRTDSGTYLCELSNPVSSQTAAYTLDVIGSQTSGCAAGCIVGIVCGCIVLVLIVSGTVFYFVRKNKKPQESNTQRDGGGQNNSADQVNYADVKFVRKGGGVVQLASPNQPEYAEVQKRTNRPPSSLPSYSDHMTAGKRQAPTPPTAETEYAGIRLK